MAPNNTVSSLPKNWPSQLPYLLSTTISASITPTHLSALRSQPIDPVCVPPNTPKGPCTLVKITPITSESHPAYGQFGLFATRDLKPGSFILLYIGELHCSAPSSNQSGTLEELEQADPHADSNYDLSLDRDLAIGIDAEKKGNEARFINDYRGVNEKGPNAEFREVWDERGGNGQAIRGMGVWVLPEGKKDKWRCKGIRKGEEILVSYGRGFWGARKKESN